MINKLILVLLFKIFTFSTAYAEHQADKGDGHWEVVIDNFKDDEFWVTPIVFLVPHGIDI